MESSEDDAGNATSASCRVSAREKAIGLVEDGGPTRNTQHEPPETSASCTTPAMSEDNFDGDSVPSPSAQDVNTSTEAILDMIDEFVDGPGAPKRLPLVSYCDERFVSNNAAESDSETETKQPGISNERPPTTPACYDKVETSNENIPEKPPESPPHSEDSTCANTSSNVRSPQESSANVGITETSSNQEQAENFSPMISVEPETPTVQSVSDSPSSSLQNVQNISNISVCEESEQSNRTVKCVTSSDNRDSVTVEKAESTSSECSVSESKELSVEPSIKSPLKRRLVRPMPGDRRPDSTVSSTVDSQAANIHPTQSTSCEVVAKDVSSSSDAVSLQLGNVKPEEISNVSEISICKAETSTAPKKIRLVRPKATPTRSNSVKSPDDVTPDKEQCQSTSSDEQVAPIFPVVPSPATVPEAPTSQDVRPGSPIPSVNDDTTHDTPVEIVHEKCHAKEDVISDIQNESVSLNKHSETLSEESETLNEESETVPKEVPHEVSLVPEPISLQIEETSSSNIQSELTADVLSKQTTQIETTKVSSKYVCKITTGPLEPQLKDPEPNSSQLKETVQSEKSDESQQKSIPIETQSKNIAPKLSQSELLESLQAKPIEKELQENETYIQKVIETKTKVPTFFESKTEPTEMISVAQVTIENQSKATSTQSTSRVQLNEETTDSKPKLLKKVQSEQKPIESQSTGLTREPLISTEEPTKSQVYENPTPLIESSHIKPKEEQPEVQPNLEVQTPGQSQVQPNSANVADSNLEVHQFQSKENKPIRNQEDLEPTNIQAKQAELKLKEAELKICDSNKIQHHNLTNYIELDQVQSASTNIKLDPTESMEVDLVPNSVQNAVVSEAVKSETIDLDSIKKLPPIKLTLTKVSKTEMKTNDLRSSSISKKDNALDTAIQFQPDVLLHVDTTLTCDSSTTNDLSEMAVDQKKVPPIKLNLSSSDNNSSLSSPQKINAIEDKPDSTKQVPKLTIKLGSKQVDEMKSPVPKLTIKPIQPPVDQNSEESLDNNQQILKVTKLNIKPIVKPIDEGECPATADLNEHASKKEQFPSITKLNIKPIPKPAEKINDMHRKSSSSEISESEYSENDETSTSDQTSASDQGPSDTVPKVTIKLGKPGTESEGQFYTKKNIPKLTIKGLNQNESEEKDAKLKLIISQSEDMTMEKVPKLTIKTKTKAESQPLSPKLTIKPIRPPENENKILKLKITTDAFGSSSEIKESLHVPKLTIKAVPKTESDTICKTPKKSTHLVCDSSDQIPTVTKLNIKPILKPLDSGETSEDLDKVPVVSKLIIKPIVKPKDNEVDSSVENVPKIKKNNKNLKTPEESSSEKKDCDENIVDMVDKSIPVITKLNIKPIVKPEEHESLKDSENQSSETGTSSDENSDIPIVTKLNIKPILKPSEIDEGTKHNSNEQSFPLVTKLNIKPIVKPEENTQPLSPKKETIKGPGSSGIPTVTKLNIKPIVKPEEISNESKLNDDDIEKSKNPPLLMKINMKNVCDSASDQKYNSYVDGTKSPKQPMSPKIKKTNLTPDRDRPRKNMDASPDSSNLVTSVPQSSFASNLNCLNECNNMLNSKENKSLSIDTRPVQISSNKKATLVNEVLDKKLDLVSASPISPGTAKQKKSLQNCTLLKQLLSNTKDDTEKSREMSISNCIPQPEKAEMSVINCSAPSNVKTYYVDGINKHNPDSSEFGRRSPIPENANDLSHSSKSAKTRSIQELRKEVSESVTKPLEIITDKVSNLSSGQDSPRIILKINKTDHGPSAKIITEEAHKPVDSPPQNHADNTHETVQEKQSPKKHYNVSIRKKLLAEEAISLTIGKRLRSSRVVDTPENSPSILKRNPVKRTLISETSPTSNKESELSAFDSKRLKLEQLLSVNKGLTITPVASNFTQTPLTKPKTEIKQAEKKNHSLLNNDNSKNGNSKLHNILSNLQAKQMQTLQLSQSTITNDPLLPDAESNASTGSSDVVVEISRIGNCHPNVQEMIINENSDFRDMSTPDDVSQDPLEVDALKTVAEVPEPPSIKAVEVTPTPRKRGRPRKIPLSEGAKPAKPPTPTTLPVSALDERPQRSLRLMREKPIILTKPRGRGRGRGARRIMSPIVAPRPPSDDESTETVIVIETINENEPLQPATPARPVTPEDPTSSRIKLPRMTEALDKSSACMTPLSSRRRSSLDMKLFGEPSVVADSPVKLDEFMKSPEKGVRGRGRGRGTPRGRTPRGRGRGRGGGKGATYMKETMGIYGRVCGPATTTVELFEEETCMMDDNATPKPSHLLDEDSQSSVKSSTNESSSKMKKSKFADLFDSNKVWTAADVKEYTWPCRDVPDMDHQVMMVQEQVAMFLGVKSFKRRYPEIKRRAIVGEEKDYCLSRGIVTEALCDLGSTAVDASDVLDIMLSDYPHKYEEYRSHQRERALTESIEEDAKMEEKPTKIEMKIEKTDKPEPPKVDPEKTRQDMAAAAIASAAEWNTMANAWRRPACVDLQSNTIHRRRAPPTSAPIHCRPPLGFYPHAILPGQFQHAFRTYTPEQLRYFPLNTVIAAPPAPPSPAESSSESEGSWADSSSSSEGSHGPQHAKRKKLTKVKRSSQLDKDKEDSRGPSAPEEPVDLCRVCKLRLEANRKYTHERFIVCSQCNSKVHPGCSELGADTIRKCREYAWQCGACKTCSTCRKPVARDALHCELCDRAHHLHCVDLTQPPTGRWHCVECAVCKSCGAREPGGPPAAAGGAGGSGAGADWHHQTRRGPGGHKVYSHSLCTPCARAYRIGRYCPLCDRSFIGPKGTMQLVICKLCDRQLHQECVRGHVSTLNVMDYTCADCRRGGITSRAGAVRAAPRTIATLFMAKRRFNKYAHRQYMQSRLKEADPDPDPEPAEPSDPETCDVSDPLDPSDSRTSE